MGRRLLGSFGLVVLLLWPAWVAQSQAQSPFQVAVTASPDAVLPARSPTCKPGTIVVIKRSNAIGIGSRYAAAPFSIVG